METTKIRLVSVILLTLSILGLLCLTALQTAQVRILSATPAAVITQMVMETQNPWFSMHFQELPHLSQNPNSGATLLQTVDFILSQIAQSPEWINTTTLVAQLGTLQQPLHLAPPAERLRLLSQSLRTPRDTVPFAVTHQTILHLLVTALETSRLSAEAWAILHAVLPATSLLLLIGTLPLSIASLLLLTTSTPTITTSSSSAIILASTIIAGVEGTRPLRRRPHHRIVHIIATVTLVVIHLILIALLLVVMGSLEPRVPMAAAAQPHRPEQPLLLWRNSSASSWTIEALTGWSANVAAALSDTRLSPLHATPLRQLKNDLDQLLQQLLILSNTRRPTTTWSVQFWSAWNTLATTLSTSPSSLKPSDPWSGKTSTSSSRLMLNPLVDTLLTSLLTILGLNTVTLVLLTTLLVLVVNK